MRYTIPEPVSVHSLVMHDQAVLHVRQHGDPSAPRIAICHGNGLATDAYFPFWQHLLDDFELIVFDVRNHGHNPTHEIEAHCWDNFVRDLDRVTAEIDARLGAKKWLGAFHSLSAIASLSHVLNDPSRWAGLALFDPPICPPEDHDLHARFMEDMEIMTRRARRRPERYGSEASFEFQLRAGREFQQWVPGAHRLMSQVTLCGDGDGGFELACPRDFEAKIFETNIDPTIWPRVATIDVPLLIVGADPDAPVTRAPAEMARGLATAHDLPYRCLPGTTHFLQIEAPEACADAVRDFSRSIGHGSRPGADADDGPALAGPAPR